MSQPQYPDAGADNGGQNPWPSYNMPQSQVPYNAYSAPQSQQNMYGYGYSTPAASTPDAMLAYQPASMSGPIASVKRRPYLLALLVFPFQCVKVFVLPMPAAFAREKDRAGWSAILSLLVPLALLAALLLYAWGRTSRITLAVQALSRGRIIVHPLAANTCEILAVVSVLVFLLLIGMMHWFAKKMGGKGKYRAQLYTSLLISIPLFVFIAIAVLALTYIPALSSSLQMLLGLIVLVFLVYSILLHICAVMAVQGLGPGKATLVVLGIVVVLLVFIVIAALLIMALGDNNSSSSGNSSHSGSGSKHSNKTSGAAATTQKQDGKGGTERHDDFDFDSEGEGHKAHHASSVMVMAYCPRCGLRTSLPGWQAQIGVSCPRCGMPMIMA